MPDIESDVDEPIVACLTCVQNYCGAKLTESQREHFNSDSKLLNIFAQHDLAN